MFQRREWFAADSLNSTKQNAIVTSNNSSESSGAPIIVVEGIDGSGKGTQAKRLFESLTQAGYRCELFSFPRYEETFFGARVGDFLNGKFGSLEDLHPFLVSLLYSGDRFESRTRILEAQQNADILIFDRYVASNVAHQSAKVAAEERRELRDWIEHIEYEIFDLPRPDCVVLLDTPVDTSQKLISQKEARSYTDQKADIQEADTTYMQKVRVVYLDIAADSPNWTVIPVTEQDRVRSIDDIAKDTRRIALTLLPAPGTK